MSKETTSPIDFVEIYEALDTVKADISELRTTNLELLEECEDLNDKQILAIETAKDFAHIRQRQEYILGKAVSGPLSRGELTDAARNYANAYDPDDGRSAAIKRAKAYNRIIELAGSGAININFDLADLEPRAVQKVSYVTKLHGRRVEDTNKVWINPLDPRGVEYVPAGSTERIIDQYGIQEHEYDDVTGVHVVTASRRGQDPDFTQTLTFDDENDTYRIVKGPKGEDVLEKYIPSGRVSLFGLESVVHGEQGMDETLRIAEEATRFNLPNIITTFEHPDNANPVPIPVAKRD